MTFNPDNVTNTQVGQGDINSAPRVRVNGVYTDAVPLTLTTSWQKLDFGGTSTRNVNTFPMSTDGIHQMVYWDTTAGKFKYMSATDRNYNFTLFLKTTSSSILNLTNLSMATVQIQFVVPGGNSDGSDYKFPFPDDTDPAEDLFIANSISPYRTEYATNLYVDDKKRAGGMYVNIRLSGTVLGTIKVVATNQIHYGR